MKQTKVQMVDTNGVVYAESGKKLDVAKKIYKRSCENCNQKIKDIIKDLENNRLCPYCGHPLFVNDHYCEDCKERISVPTDTDNLIKFIKYRWRRNERNI